jgi:hypothetical protein
MIKVSNQAAGIQDRNLPVSIASTVLAYVFVFLICYRQLSGKGTQRNDKLPELLPRMLMVEMRLQSISPSITGEFV